MSREKIIQSIEDYKAFTELQEQLAAKQKEIERLKALIEKIYTQSEIEMHQELGHDPDEYELRVENDWQQFKAENKI